MTTNLIECLLSTGVTHVRGLSINQELSQEHSLELDHSLDLDQELEVGAADILKRH